MNNDMKYDNTKVNVLDEAQGLQPNPSSNLTIMAMSEQKYIGIDAGLDGAIVTLDSAGNICETREMPSVKIGKGREIDYAAIALMFKWEFLQDSIITIENPGKHAPGASGLWSMTTCFSAIRMATVGYDYRHLIVTAKE